jgi:PEP-CTERM motif
MNAFAKIAVVAAGAALAVQGVFAGPNNNNLILSINNNNNGGSTEFTVNLGQVSSFSAPNFDLSSFVLSFSSYTSAGATGLNIGVVGGQNGQGGLTGTGNDVYTTTLRAGSGSYLNPGTEGAPSVNPSKALIANAGGITGGFSGYAANLSISDSTSFSSNIAKDPSTAGTAANSFVGYLGQGANPLQTMTGDTIVLDLWKNTVTGSGTTGWAYEGNLTFDKSGSTPTLTWDASPVPEPSTFSLFTGAGLLALSFRRRFGRKNA